MEIFASNLDQAVIMLSRKILTNGVNVTRRGFKCREIPEAVLVQISCPCDRYVTIPARKWNKTLGWMESLWLARGDNRMDMPKAYVKNLMNFSDDGVYMRAGYGPRIRRYGSNVSHMLMPDGTTASYQYGNFSDDELSVDQLRFVLEKFCEDIDTREAVITIHDPIADDFNFKNKKALLKTKDTPCTRSIHFMAVNGKLNCYVHLRSNDLVWGFSAVNVFNFTLMQEYIASMLKIPVGAYYHYADNMHVYEDFLSLVEAMASEDLCNYPAQEFYYRQDIDSLSDFNLEVGRLSDFEMLARMGKTAELEQDSDMFRDWATVLERRWNKACDKKFINPILNNLYGL